MTGKEGSTRARKGKPGSIEVPLSSLPAQFDLLALASRCDPADLSLRELEPLSREDRKEVARLLFFLADGISKKQPAHRPADQDKKFWAAVEVASRPSQETIETAQRRVAKRWRFGEETMRRAVWLGHKKQAQEFVSKWGDPAALRGVLDYQHRRLCKK